MDAGSMQWTCGGVITVRSLSVETAADDAASATHSSAPSALCSSESSLI